MVEREKTLGDNKQWNQFWIPIFRLMKQDWKKLMFLLIVVLKIFVLLLLWVRPWEDPDRIEAIWITISLALAYIGVCISYSAFLFAHYAKKLDN